MISPHRSGLLQRLVPIVALATLLVGCGGAPGPRSVTDAEADRLAEVLFTNWDSEGAHFGLSVLANDGSTIQIEGVMDFRNVVGHAHIAGTGPHAAVPEVFWDETVVLERRPAFTDLAARYGLGNFEFVARPPDPEFYEVDQILAVITGLYNVRRDNPLLIQQDPNTRWLRSDTLRDTEVDVFQTGERSRMWLEKGSSRLLRFESDNSLGTRPIVIDIYELGPQAIVPPADAVVADAVVYREAYEASGGTLPSWLNDVVTPSPSAQG